MKNQKLIALNLVLKLTLASTAFAQQAPILDPPGLSDPTELESFRRVRQSMSSEAARHASEAARYRRDFVTNRDHGAKLTERATAIRAELRTAQGDRRKQLEAELASISSTFDSHQGRLPSISSLYEGLIAESDRSARRFNGVASRLPAMAKAVHDAAIRKAMIDAGTAEIRATVGQGNLAGCVPGAGSGSGRATASAAGAGDGSGSGSAAAPGALSLDPSLDLTRRVLVSAADFAPRESEADRMARLEAMDRMDLIRDHDRHIAAIEEGFRAKKMTKREYDCSVAFERQWFHGYMCRRPAGDCTLARDAKRDWDKLRCPGNTGRYFTVSHGSASN